MNFEFGSWYSWGIAEFYVRFSRCNALCTVIDKLCVLWNPTANRILLKRNLSLLFTLCKYFDCFLENSCFPTRQECVTAKDWITQAIHIIQFLYNLLSLTEADSSDVNKAEYRHMLTGMSIAYCTVGLRKQIIRLFSVSKYLLLLSHSFFRNFSWKAASKHWILLS